MEASLLLVLTAADHACIKLRDEGVRGEEESRMPDLGTQR